jgi:hypothetical protein
MEAITDDEGLGPRSMRDGSVRERRRLMLDLPHVVRLAAYAAGLRESGSLEVPDFDPCDGGSGARVLFLFEKPGPMTAQGAGKGGSGFISRDNDDPTAEATFMFMQQAGLPRKLTVIWNVIPWWNGTVTVTRQERIAGAKVVRDLMELLPELRAVVMVGRNAAATRPYLETTGKALFTSDHPSPRVKARWPERWRAIPSEWAQVRKYIDGAKSHNQ